MIQSVRRRIDASAGTCCPVDPASKRGFLLLPFVIRHCVVFTFFPPSPVPPATHPLVHTPTRPSTHPPTHMSLYNQPPPPPPQSNLYGGVQYPPMPALTGYVGPAGTTTTTTTTPSTGTLIPDLAALEQLRYEGNPVVARCRYCRYCRCHRRRRSRPRSKSELEQLLQDEQAFVDFVQHASAKIASTQTSPSNNNNNNSSSSNNNNDSNNNNASEDSLEVSFGSHISRDVKRQNYQLASMCLLLPIAAVVVVKYWDLIFKESNLNYVEAIEETKARLESAQEEYQKNRETLIALLKQQESLGRVFAVHWVIVLSAHTSPTK